MTRALAFFCAISVALVCRVIPAAEDDAPQLFAEPRQDWVWDEDKRFDFLMERLASLEASLDAVNAEVNKTSGKKTTKRTQARQAEDNNTMMDRKGGGPMAWQVFYGTNAEKFFYHPVDPSTMYRTDTLLRQMGSYQDDKVGSGVPASQSLPVHQRPPQWDYIYRANRDAAERAEEEAQKLEGKVDELLERRFQLEKEQADLWAKLAFRIIERLNIPRKPVLRFQLVGATTEPDDVQKAAALQAAARFLSVSLLVIDKAEKEQATALTSVKTVVASAREALDDDLLGADAVAEAVADKQTALGKYVALAQLLDDTANNLGESYEVAMEGDQANDEARKDRFRGLLQRSLVEYAEILLALDELAEAMKEEWAVKVNTKSKLPAIEVAWIEALPAETKVSPSSRALTKKPTSKSSAAKKSRKPVVFQFSNEEQIKDAWVLNGDWRIQNNRLRFADGGTLESAFRVGGDAIIQVDYGGGLYQRMRVRAWNQSFVAQRSFTIARKGGDIVYTEQGKQPTVITLKQDERTALSDTKLFLSFESNSSTTSHVIGGVAVSGEIIEPED